MFSRVFIERPITAIVISIFIVIIGVLAILALPIAQYPEITPPVVQVTGNYAGAGSTVVENAITTPIEQQINGVKGMMYQQSSSVNDGTFIINVTFELGTDVDVAALDVQNRVSLALPTLPEDIKRTGVSTKKRSPSMLQIIALYSPQGTHSKEYVDNYINYYLKPRLGRLKGVGDVSSFGKDFAMRIWLNPQRMAQLKISTADVIAAVREQNTQVPAGAIGRPPVPSAQSFEYTINVKGKLNSAEEFKQIVIAQNPETGALTRLGDIAEVALGAASYIGGQTVNGKIGSGLAIYQTPGGNALETAKLIAEELREIEKDFPPDLKWTLVYDTTKFVEVSIKEVVSTFMEALVLVLIVVFFFLQSFKATLIPMLAVPVSIIGTFAVFVALGFNINTLTLFAMILAIGIVVDDAIVVVEAVQHNIDENKMSAKEATLKAMQEVGGPVIAMSFILTAVFLPVAFIPGIAGQLYKQFAVTIAVSVLISGLVALTLTPALCSLLMSKNPVNAESKGMYRFFYRFNVWFDKQSNRYGGVVKKTLKTVPMMLILLVCIYVGTGLLGKSTPTSFIPYEDQGVIMMGVELPVGASQNRTEQALAKVIKEVEQNPYIDNFFTIANFSLLSSTNVASSASVFIMLKPWEQRTTKDASLSGVIADLNRRLAPINEANILIVPPAPIPGLGTTGGFSFMIKQSTGDIKELEKVTNDFLFSLRSNNKIGTAFCTYSANNPEIELEVDRDKCKKLNVELSEVHNAIQTFLGGYYINDFDIYNRNFKVYAQAEGEFRQDINKLAQCFVRSRNGDMLPLSALVNHKPIQGASLISHFNLDRSVEINGEPAPGISSGEVIDILKETAARVLPQGYTYEFSGTSRQEIESGGVIAIIFSLSVLFVFLLLAALYESWSVPFAVLLSVPAGALGAFIGLNLMGLSNSIYAQIGLVTLIGLAAKNAILIVEFCKEQYEKGVPLQKAVIEASKLRLRPILMTAFSFILGVIPLLISSGAGAAARVNLGATVFFGMLFATTLGLFFVPVLYYWIARMSSKKTEEIAD